VRCTRTLTENHLRGCRESAWEASSAREDRELSTQVQARDSQERGSVRT